MPNTILGEGTYSVVHPRGKNAVKVIKFDKNDIDFYSITREVANGFYLKGIPGLISYDDVSVDEKSGRITMKKYPHTLDNLTLRSVDSVLKIMESLIRTVYNMHLNGVLHLDIKPENILMTETSRPVLIDFGIGTFGDIFALKKDTCVQTISYRAPEILMEYVKKFKGYHHSVDVFSLGVIFYELLFNCIFIGGIDEKDIKYCPDEIVDYYNKCSQSENVKVKFIYLIAIYKNYANLEENVGQRFDKDPRRESILSVLQGMLNPDGLKRMNSGEALSHPIFETGEQFPLTPSSVYQNLIKKPSSHYSIPGLFMGAFDDKARNRIRVILFNWILQVIDTKEMHQEIFFDFVRIYDSICEKVVLPLEKIQGYGIASLYIADLVYGDTSELYYDRLSYLTAGSSSLSDIFSACANILEKCKTTLLAPSEYHLMSISEEKFDVTKVIRLLYRYTLDRGTRTKTSYELLTDAIKGIDVEIEVDPKYCILYQKTK